MDAWARRAEEGRWLGEGSGLASEGALNSREGEWKGAGELSRRGNGVSGYAAAWLFCEAGAQEGMTGPVGAEEGAQADGPASGSAQGERPPEQ